MAIPAGVIPTRELLEKSGLTRNQHSHLREVCPTAPEPAVRVGPVAFWKEEDVETFRNLAQARRDRLGA